MADAYDGSGFSSGITYAGIAGVGSSVVVKGIAEYERRSVAGATVCAAGRVGTFLSALGAALTAGADLSEVEPVRVDDCVMGAVAPIPPSFAQCVSNRDPLSNANKLGLTAAGATVPKKWTGLPLGLDKAKVSPFTTPPSVVAHKVYGGQARHSKVGSTLRTFGRISSLGFIGYGWAMIGIQADCAITR